MTIDSLSRKLATLASTNAAAALTMATTANQRIASIPLFSGLPNTSFDSSITTVVTGGNAAAGMGGASYVCDGLATSALATSNPALCKMSADGRYWRLAPVNGAIAAEQCGAVANDTTMGTANVAALRAALSYVSQVCNGGVVLCGPGLFTLDAASLGNDGLAIPSSVVIRGQRGSTVWAPSSTPADHMVNIMGANDVAIEDIELRGTVLFANTSRAALRRVKVVGRLSSTVQFAETGIAVASYFGGTGQTYQDAAGSISGSDFGHTMAGSVMTTTMSSGTPGVTQQARYAVSDFIPLNSALRYVVEFQPGFLGGAGAAAPMITLYNSAKTPLASGQSNSPTNLFIGSNESQNGTISAAIMNAAYMKIAVGSYRDYTTATGLAATFDLSKIIIYSASNDLATQGLTASPGDAAQIQVSSCTDMVIDDCDFRLVNRSCVKLISCTSCSITRSRVRYSYQGFTDDGGKGNRITDNDIDLRLATSGGDLIGNKLLRLRGLGGVGSNGGDYSRNRIQGASWGIEFLPNNPAYRNTASHNVIDAEFAGMSLTTGDWVVANNRISLCSQGLYGIELPGVDSVNAVSATASGNVIQWRDFSGYLGFGISATCVGKVAVQGGFIRAPVVIQNAGTNISGELVIDGTVGEFGATALLGRDSAISARFAALRPYILCYPYGSGTSGAVIDFKPSSSANPLSLRIDHLVPGAASITQISNCSNVSLTMPDIRPTGYVTSQYIRIDWPTNAPASITLKDCNFTNPPADMSRSQWCSLGSTVPQTGSKVVMQGNVWGLQKVPAPSGNYVRAIVSGDPLLSGYTSSAAIGSIAAGGSWTTSLAAFGACTTDRGYDVQPGTPGALAGLIVQCWGSSDDNVTVQITNPGSTARTVGTVSLWVNGLRSA
ncbi:MULTISPECIES: right-handed parallel beta-helix repeat-containing protein [unclassified Novosphingobium]|uniref:right-handed parallel beta-helix repeat-containing protein n=1 Tax=unclassified Novosphingobium TaxID=2644732 RepID=UPI00086D9E47|nr:MULTISPECIES: right-handed parallel beta-helix repeat-containing protein [unclassified Novosphingobium]MBN9142845.1 right-handed parallel beta-helix repeat-containing protein [Novosphingobium sp.]MDR6705930.1 hypothetical protein [Novosphingobium sp. 1748]ODU84996.1 MAG: hypothetical protein ABT10_01750 [Novosphingobium sp. SCN 63-17]OJX89224.1 MAG: hypothetical protein BGP00_13325 [Novosphingobium sp. 63-713]